MTVFQWKKYFIIAKCPGRLLVTLDSSVIGSYLFSVMLENSLSEELRSEIAVFLHTRVHSSLKYTSGGAFILDYPNLVVFCNHIKNVV